MDIAVRRDFGGILLASSFVIAIVTGCEMRGQSQPAFEVASVKLTGRPPKSSTTDGLSATEPSRHMTLGSGPWSQWHTASTLLRFMEGRHGLTQNNTMSLRKRRARKPWTDALVLQDSRRHCRQPNVQSSAETLRVSA
jgi:hypothetical protein